MLLRNLLFIISCYSLYKLIYSNTIHIPVTLPDATGNYFEVNLAIDLLDRIPRDVIVETFCRKHNILNIYCNQIKEQATQYIENIIKQNTMITIPIKYVDPRTGDLKEVVFEVHKDEQLKDILLSSFCIKNNIDDDACNDIMNVVEKKMEQVKIFEKALVQGNTPSNPSTTTSNTNDMNQNSQTNMNHQILESSIISKDTLLSSVSRDHIIYDDKEIVRIPMNIMDPSGESSKVEIFEVNKNEPLVDVMVNTFCRKHQLTSQYCELLYKNTLLSMNIKKGYKLKPITDIMHSNNAISISYGMKQYPNVIESEINRLFINKHNLEEKEQINKLLLKENEIYQSLLLDLELVIAKKVCIIHSVTLKANHYIILEEIMNYLIQSELMVDLDGIIVFNYGYPINIDFQKKYGSVTFLQVSNNNHYFEITTLRILSKLVSYWNNKDIYTHVLYLHTLGSQYLEDYSHINQWRQLLLYYLVEKHITSYHLLESEEIDCVGVNLMKDSPLHFHGHYWWSRVDYLVKLPEISYEIGGRYETDLWILSSSEVRPYAMHTSYINHYVQAYPRKCYTSQSRIVTSSSSLSDDLTCHEVINKAVVDQNIIKALNS